MEKKLPKVIKKNAIVKAKKENISLTKGELTRDKIELLKRTIAVGATDDELQMFLYVAQRSQLDPLLKQIYLVKRYDSKTGGEKATIQIGIDGLRSVAERTGKYAGSDDPVYEKVPGLDKPIKATVTIWKIVEGQRVSFTASARWSEYCPGEKLAFMWNSKPYLMLGKVAEALALRKAFPTQASGLYVHEEMDKANDSSIVIANPSESSSPKDNSKDVELPKTNWPNDKRMRMSLARIQADDNRDRLSEIYETIQSNVGNFYTKEEQTILIQAIANQRKKYVAEDKARFIKI